jgi:uncharacterized membrane-anchored protein
MKKQLYSGELQGPIFYGVKTKELIKWIPLGAFALLEHEDIDEMAAHSLIQKKVKGVLNYSASMTGLYPSLGTKKLIKANIPVYDIVHPGDVKRTIQQGDVIRIVSNEFVIENTNNNVAGSFSLQSYTEEHVQQKFAIAKTKLHDSLRSFTENTLDFAYQEMHEILKPITIPPLAISLENRHVVVVTRGNGYIEDLKAIKGYIREKNPIFIGVDGGADAILECGYSPHIIIGDMDSVSQKALRSGAEIVVHAYSDGVAPGLEFVREQGLKAHIFPCFGTSEDAAQLLAYEGGALLIVTLGSHTNMVDFLEKGRRGMGSTLLVRLKIGEKLVDAKGVSLLYPESAQIKKYKYMSKVRSLFGFV